MKRIFVIIIIGTFLFYGCSDENMIEKISYQESLKEIDNLNQEISQLTKENEQLKKKVDQDKRQIEMLEVKLDDLEVRPESEHSIDSKFGSYAEFIMALEANDDTLEKLIDFYDLEICDGAYGQAYGGRLLHYFLETDLDEFLKKCRKYNDRSIDSVTYKSGR